MAKSSLMETVNRWLAEALVYLMGPISGLLAVIQLVKQESQIMAQKVVNRAHQDYQDIPLDPAILADMVERMIISEADAIPEAAMSSIDKERFKKMVLVTGEPPGLMQMLNLWRRGLLDVSELDRMVAYSRVRTEWTKYIKLLAHDTMSQSDALTAAVKGVITPQEATKLFVEAGGLADQFQTLLDTGGDAIGVEAVEHLWLHKLATTEDVHRVIRHSRINPMFEELATKLYHRYLTGFQIKTIVQEGGATPAQATEWLIEQGYPADQAAAFTGAVAHGTATKVHDITEAQTLELYESKFITEADAKKILTHLGYPAEVQTYLLEITDAHRALTAINQAVTFVRKAYLAGRINDNEVKTRLGELQVPQKAITEYLAAWSIEKATEFRTLTPTEIGSAVKKGIITPDDAVNRWRNMGFDEADAAVLLALHGGPMPQGAPATVKGP